MQLEQKVAEASARVRDWTAAKSSNLSSLFPDQLSQWRKQAHDESASVDFAAGYDAQVDTHHVPGRLSDLERSITPVVVVPLPPALPQNQPAVAPKLPAEVGGALFAHLRLASACLHAVSLDHH